jgi:hypothetical protein
MDSHFTRHGLRRHGKLDLVMLAIFTQTRMHNTTAPYYPLGTVGTVPRAYDILGPTEE